MQLRQPKNVVKVTHWKQFTFVGWIWSGGTLISCLSTTHRTLIAMVHRHGIQSLGIMPSVQILDTIPTQQGVHRAIVGVTLYIRKGMFLVGCCLWLRSILYSN